MHPTASSDATVVLSALRDAAARLAVSNEIADAEEKRIISANLASLMNAITDGGVSSSWV